MKKSVPVVSLAICYGKTLNLNFSKLIWTQIEPFYSKVARYQKSQEWNDLQSNLGDDLLKIDGSDNFQRTDFLILTTAWFNITIFTSLFFMFVWTN